jgi:hypothetical protein
MKIISCYVTLINFDLILAKRYPSRTIMGQHLCRYVEIIAKMWPRRTITWQTLSDLSILLETLQQIFYSLSEGTGMLAILKQITRMVLETL